MGGGTLTDQRSIGLIAPTEDIPPPPDGSAVVAAQDHIPPPPDGSGVDQSQDTVATPDAAVAVNADQLSPEDTAHLTDLYHTGTAGQIAAFLHSRGRTSDIGALADYVAKRDGGKAQMNYTPNYQGKTVDDLGTGGALARGAAQGITLNHADEIHGFLNGVGSLLKGGSYADAYDKTVDQDRAYDGLDSQNHALAQIGGNLAGGALLPFGLAKAGLTPALETVALNAGREAVAAGATADAAKVIAARAVAKRVALEGGAYGVGYGEGGAEGGPLERAEGAVIGGAEGLAGGALLGRLGVRSATKAAEAATAAPSEARQIADAAANQGIDLLPADVGGATTRRLTAGAAQTPFGAGPIAQASQRMTEQAQAARDRVAASVGQALAPEQMGQNALAGAQQYIANSRTATGAMYRAAEQAAGDTRITPTNALDNLNQHIAELGETPGGAPGMQTLEGLRDALSSGDVTVRGLRNMRTVLRDQFIKDGLRGSDIERRVGQVLDASRDDLTQGLTDAGKPEAAALFGRADAAYRDRVQTIDNVLKPLIGTKDAPVPAEQIASKLTTDLRNNNARAVKFLNTLPPEEQANTRASIIGQLGRVSAGADNPEGDRFSLPAFLTAYNKIGDTAKRAYFGAEAMSALNDLAKVADGAKLAQRYANHSNTGGALETGRLLTAVTALPTLGASVGGQFALGHLLASPKFARWLARAPRTALSQPSYIERLGRIARAEPAIAGDVLNLQQRLSDTVSGSSARLAAQPSDDGTPVVNGQQGQQQPSYQEAQP